MPRQEHYEQEEAAEVKDSGTMQDGRLLVPQGGRFSQELEEGNIEYKWKLVNTSEERLVHLTTQLNWRLNESETGEAIYLIGACYIHTSRTSSSHSSGSVPVGVLEPYPRAWAMGQA